MKFTGRVIDGKLRTDSPASWSICMKEYDGKPVTVEIDVRRETRSTRANRRYFGILVPLAGHCLDLKRDGLPPLSKKQIHAVLVTAFVGQDETALGPVPMETHTLDTKQFFDFTEKVARWLMGQGYGIPDGPGAAVIVEEATA